MAVFGRQIPFYHIILPLMKLKHCLALSLLAAIPFYAWADQEAASEKAPVISPPTLVCPYVPMYPLALFKDKKEGNVLLEIRIDDKGKVTDSKVVESANEGFNDNAMAAAGKFVFKPGKKDGKEVPMRIRVVVAFTLDKAVLSMDDVSTPPSFKKRIRPFYPYAMLEKGIEGNAALDCVISSDGKVSVIYALDYTYSSFRDSLIAAVKEAEFNPATVDGVPVSSFYHVAYEFRIRRQWN